MFSSVPIRVIRGLPLFTLVLPRITRIAQRPPQGYFFNFEVHGAVMRWFGRVVLLLRVLGLGETSLAFPCASTYTSPSV
jgi:hypothetical protein